MKAAKKLILASSILGTTLLIMGCTPNAASVSKELIHEQDQANSQGGDSGIHNNFNDVNTAEKLVPVILNNKNAAIALLPKSPVALNLLDQGPFSNAFNELITSGKSAAIKIDPAPAKIVIVINEDDSPEDFAQAFQTGDCALQITSLGSTNWQLSLGDSSCLQDRQEIQEIFIVPMEFSAPGSNPNPSNTHNT